MHLQINNNLTAAIVQDPSKNTRFYLFIDICLYYKSYVWKYENNPPSDLRKIMATTVYWKWSNLTLKRSKNILYKQNGHFVWARLKKMIFFNDIEDVLNCSSNRVWNNRPLLRFKRIFVALVQVAWRRRDGNCRQRKTSSVNDCDRSTCTLMEGQIQIRRQKITCSSVQRRRRF